MKLKVNLKLCLLILLIGVILYCCLGNSFYEGLDVQSSNLSGSELQSCITSCNTTCQNTAKKSNPHLQGTDIGNYCESQCNISCNKIFDSQPQSAKHVLSGQSITQNRQPPSGTPITQNRQPPSASPITQNRQPPSGTPITQNRQPPSASPITQNRQPPSASPITQNRQPYFMQSIDSNYNADSPVCPICPSNNNNYGTTSCKKEKPCPPCARCPEPAFKCKEVPDYDSTNTNYLPKPILNDFSKF